MKKPLGLGIMVLLATALGETLPAFAQGELDRLESGIRASNSQPAAVVVGSQRPYLGAVADDEAGRGVRVLSIRVGGPADHAGLQAQDLIVAAAGRKIHFLSELSTIIANLKPGDRLALEVNRGNRPLHTDVILAVPPGPAPLGQGGIPTLPGNGAGPTESIPPPPGDVPPLAAPSEGPALGVPGGNPFVPNPQPAPPNSPQAQIDQLRHRVDQLERRIQELEHALAESRSK